MPILLFHQLEMSASPSGDIDYEAGSVGQLSRYVVIELGTVFLDFCLLPLSVR
jgi:hypothetical protein